MKKAIARRKIALTVLITGILILSVLAYKTVYEPFIFNPRFGVSNLYGFDFYDPQAPFTVYYVKTAQDLSSASGDSRLLNQTLQLGGKKDTVVEWEFNLEKYLGILAGVDGKLNDMAFLVSDPNPQSIAYDTSIQLYINDLLAADLELSVVNKIYHTWNLPLIWDIPGSNYAFGSYFAQIEVPIKAGFVSQAGTNPMRFKMVVDKYIHWNIKYVAVRLHSDYTEVGSPWWRQNAGSLLSLYLPFLGIALILLVLKRKGLTASVKKINGNRLLFASILLGVAARLALVSLMNFSNSFDLAVYKNVDVVTYFYGIDSRVFINMYGPILHVLLMAFYPIYLLSPFAGVPYFEILVVKLPIIISDLVIAYLLYHIGKKLTSEKNAKWLMAFWLLNPYAVYMSGIWGIYHVLPTMLGILALDRLVYSRSSQSASALAATILSGLYRLFTFPAFIIPLFRKLGRATTVSFVRVFLLTNAALLLPWAFSVAIIVNILYGPGRVGFPSVSYSFLLIPPNLWGYWTVAMLAITNAFLIVYIYRKTGVGESSSSIDFPAINEYILLSLLLFLLSSTLVFPTYILAAIPHLFIAYFARRKVPFVYIAFFMFFPVLWLFYWPLEAASIGSLEIFRDVFGLNFSILLILIIIKLLFQKPEQDLTFESPRIGFDKARLRSWFMAVPLAYLVLAVYSPWIQFTPWLDLWNTTLSSIFFVLSVSIIGIAFILRRTPYKDARFTNPSGFPSSKIQILSSLLLFIVWLYNMAYLVRNLFFVGVIFQDAVLYPAILALWSPLLILEISKTDKRQYLVTWIAFLQINYLITRNYAQLNNYLTLGISIVVSTLIVLLLFSIAYLQSRHAQNRAPQ